MTLGGGLSSVFLSDKNANHLNRMEGRDDKSSEKHKKCKSVDSVETV
jgi:hypothetical protein